MKISLVKNILQANERISEMNKKQLDEKEILTINMMSAPGAGKTTLIESTIKALKDTLNFAVIERDIQSTHDAEIFATTGAQVVQINTGGACHLDANMIKETIDKLKLDEIDVLIVENVGNLVCPAEFNIGEDYKVMLLSLPEGDDKPLKYPLIFSESSVLLINKIDLNPYVNSSVENIKKYSLRINPQLKIFPISVKTTEGLDRWHEWLLEKAREKHK